MLATLRLNRPVQIFYLTLHPQYGIIKYALGYNTNQPVMHHN